MNALLVTVMLVMTPDPSLYCEGDQSCAWIKPNQIPTVFVRSFTSPLRAHRVSLDPAKIDFPHYASSSLTAWRRCGEQIKGQAGVEAVYNQLVTLCHEVKHAMGDSH